MNIFSERSSSIYTKRNFISECQTPSKDSKGYISLSKQLNMPITQISKKTTSNQRKKIKLFDSPHLNDDTFTTLSNNQSKNEVDILSKLMNWEKMHLNQQQYTSKHYNDLKPKTEYLRNQNPKFIDINQKEHEIYIDKCKTQKQAPKSQFIPKQVQLEVQLDDMESIQMENLGPQYAQTNQQQLNQYIISIAKTTNRILPKIQLPDKNKKNNILPNLNRQNRIYSVLNDLQLQQMLDKDDSIDNITEQQQLLFRKRKTQQKKSMLRKRIIVVLAVIRISKKYRVILKERAQKTQNLDQQKSVHQKYLDQFRTKNLQYHQKDFADGIFKKLNSILLDKKYIKECEQISRLQDFIQKDIKKQRFCQFISLFLQSLEIATNQNVLPPVIVHQLNLNFFKTNNTQSCLFVLNRACYYSTLIQKITKKQQLLIATEYLIFQLVIPNIFQILKDMKIKSVEHNNQTLSYLTALTEMVQMFFVDYFKQLEKVSSKNVKPIQRILQLDIDDNSGIANSEVIITSKINQDETIIIENGFDKSSIKELQSCKPYWDEKMKSRFIKIISNIEKHILIKNN
ncbi:unnamed protein product [Paramecium pentaurelia]|uniref:Uncharacterized protein n=1 Tax=Paramecium pentaurelia TaxID=43138 RepID=A0A8S1ULM3_9CILI|nr:unnamed protein product [Paramecium pentaurelia]